MHITAAYYIIDYSPHFTPFACRVLAKPTPPKKKTLNVFLDVRPVGVVERGWWMI